MKLDQARPLHPVKAPLAVVGEQLALVGELFLVAHFSALAPVQGSVQTHLLAAQAARLLHLSCFRLVLLPLGLGLPRVRGRLGPLLPGRGPGPLLQVPGLLTHLAGGLQVLQPATIHHTHQSRHP